MTAPVQKPTEIREFEIEPMELGLPVDDEKIAEELRIRQEVAWGYFKDDYPEIMETDET